MKHLLLQLCLKVAIICLLSVYNNSYSQGIEKIRIGILYDTFNTETDVLQGFLKDNGFQHSLITFSDIVKEPGNLSEFDIIWFHKDDSIPFSGTATKPEVLDAFNEYVVSGGRIFLTQDAVRYLNILGMEPRDFEVRDKKADDSGYGRKLGIHGFLYHPVFEGLNGGSYILRPVRDTVVRCVGMFGESVPEYGKVIAVDWDYIFVRESKKLMFEYGTGKGKVLAAGAYITLSSPNISQGHLSKFLLNCIAYLHDNPFPEPPRYWYYGRHEVLPFTPIPVDADPGKSETWDTDPYLPVLGGDSATSDYWDVAGQRMFISGTPSGGVEEIWAHPFMALRDIEVEIRFEGTDSITRLSDLNPWVETQPGAYIRTYVFQGATLKEVITASVTDPSVVVHFEYRGYRKAYLQIGFKSNLRLMWPYSPSVLGNILYAWSDGLNAFIIKDQSGQFVTIAGTNLIPDTVEARQAGTDDNSLFSGSLHFSLSQGTYFDLVIAATNEGFHKTAEAYKAALNGPYAIYTNTSEYYRNFLNRTLSITTPDKTFNEGYTWAKTATDQFFVNTPGIGKSLVAGYAPTGQGWYGGHTVDGRPGYGWYFGRDAEWSGYAMLDYGDFSNVKEILSTFIKFQDLNGKIYHELSTSGIIHYDASDATPLFIVLAGRYLKHSGDLEYIRKNWAGIKKAIDYCYSTDTDGDLLIENTNVGHGWVEGGSLFGSHSSLYLTGCWAAALQEAAYMSGALELNELSGNYKKDAGRVKEIINEDFWNPEREFYYQGLFADGTYHAEPTILAAVPLYFGLGDEDKAMKVIGQYALNAYSSDWGCRIVSEFSPLFSPNGYHTGSVWPLFTGWTALAEYQYGHYVQGFMHIMNNLQVYKHWGLGYVEEVLHGLEYKPSGVCHHQCWSETMVLQPIVEGMLGLEPNAVEHKISLSPRFPPQWDEVSVNHILGRDINMKMERMRDTLTFTFTSSEDETWHLLFDPVLPDGTLISEIILNSKSNTIKTKELPLAFDLEDKVTINFIYAGGIGVIPIVPDPQPGDESNGFRIIETAMQDHEYKIILEGRSNALETLQVWHNDLEIKDILNGELISNKDNILKIRVQFDDRDVKYTEKHITILLEF